MRARQCSEMTLNLMPKVKGSGNLFAANKIFIAEMRRMGFVSHNLRSATQNVSIFEM